MKERNKFCFLLNALIILLIVLTFTISNICDVTTLTNTRYIKRETDEIRGYYTSLYFNGTGEGNCIVLEDDVGYTSFDLMNYIGEDVTKRDISYKIRTLDTMYDKSGNVITNPSDSTPLYVKDVWGIPQPIKQDTYKYDFDVVTNTAEKSSDTDYPYLFSYQPNGTSAIGKKHAVTLKVTRKKGLNPINDLENISVAIELLKPYKEVYIINMVVVNRLIAFADMEKTQFEVGFKSLNIQTADIFTRSIKTNESSKEIGTKAFKVTLEWENLILDKRDLSILHNVVDLNELLDAIYNRSSIYDASNIDITKPYVLGLTYESDDITCGKLEIYVPQSSNFNLDFFPKNKDNETDFKYSIYAKVEIFDEATSGEYVLYNEAYGGYTTAEISQTKANYIYVLGNKEDEKIVH